MGYEKISTATVFTASPLSWPDYFASSSILAAIDHDISIPVHSKASFDSRDLSLLTANGVSGPLRLYWFLRHGDRLYQPSENRSGV